MFVHNDGEYWIERRKSMRGAAAVYIVWHIAGGGPVTDVPPSARQKNIGEARSLSDARMIIIKHKGMSDVYHG